MKKLILIFVVAMLTIVNISAIDFIGYSRIEYFNTNANSYYLSTTTRYGGQTFTIGTLEQGNYTLKGISLSLRRTGSPDMVTVGLYATNSTGFPNGTVLSQITFNATSNLTTNSAWINFTMPDYILVNGTKYAIVINKTSTGSLEYNATDPSALYAGGNTIDNNGGAGWVSQNADTYFEVYGKNATSRIELNSPADSYQTNNATVTFNCSGFASQNMLNMSLVLNGTINYTVYNTTTNQYQLDITTQQTLSLGSHNWSCIYYTTGINVTSATRTISYVPYIINSITYNNITTSGAVEPFTLNLSYDSGYSGIIVYLNYNNTNYSTSSSGTGYNKLFWSNVTVPSVASITNKTFYFIFGLNNGTVISYYSSNLYNQTISPFFIDNCTTNNHTLFNFSMIDEETLNPMNGTIEYAISLYSYNDNNLLITYNSSVSYLVGRDFKVCVNSLNSTYYLGYNIRHYATDYLKKYRTNQRMTITNTTAMQTLTLYNLLSASGYPFKIILTGNIATSNGNSNLQVEIQKQYISQNLFNLVESSVSDSEGNAIGNLIPNTATYNFVVTYYGTAIATINNYRVQCQNPSISQCSIQLNLARATAGISAFAEYINVSTVYTLDRTTNILYLTYTSTNGLAHSLYLDVVKNDGYGNTTICSTGSSGISGTLQCTIPTPYTNSSFFANLYVDGTFAGSTFFSLGTDISDLDLYNVDIIMELFMYSTIVMLMISNPITIVIGAMMGITFAIMLLFATSGSFGAIISAVIYFLIAGGIIIWQISRRI